MVIAVSSGAALRGSPLSGGYAGAKATIRFIASYAADESGARRAGHPVRRGASRPDAGDRARPRRGRRLRRPGGRWTFAGRVTAGPAPCSPPPQPDKEIAYGLLADPGQAKDAYLLSAAA